MVGTIAVSGMAQAPAAASSTTTPFRILSSVNAFQVEIYKSAPLPQVLDALCRRTGIRCAGLELLTNYSVPPMALQGTLLQVVEHLLEGTSTNFEYIHASPEAPTEALLLTRRPQPDVSSPIPQASAKAGNSRSSGIHLEGDRNLPPLEVTTLPAEDPNPTADLPDSGASTADPDPASPAEDSTVPPQSAQIQQAVQLMFAGGYAAQVIPSAFLPFPDKDGNAIPATPEQEPKYLPFPDTFGNPIPAVPGPPGPPFPISKAGQPE